MNASRWNHYVWPGGIVVGLLIVVLVNAGMMFVAIDGADPVVPSYQHGPR